MTEQAMGWLAFGRLGVVAVFALLYQLGGRSNKYIRRWVGGLFLAVALIILSLIDHAFKWPLLALLGIIPGLLSLGYGAGDKARSVQRRFIYGMAWGVAAIALSLVTHTLALGIFQAIMAVGISTLFGTFGMGDDNPVSAPEEETIIATLSVVLWPFMV